MSADEIPMRNVIDLFKETKDDGTFYSNIYNLYVVIGIVKGISNVKDGTCITLEELEKEMEALYENYNRRFG